jgi:hypothetical protein
MRRKRVPDDLDVIDDDDGHCDRCAGQGNYYGSKDEGHAKVAWALAGFIAAIAGFLALKVISQGETIARQDERITRQRDDLNKQNDRLSYLERYLEQSQERERGR